MTDLIANHPSSDLPDQPGSHYAAFPTHLDGWKALAWDRHQHILELKAQVAELEADKTRIKGSNIRLERDAWGRAAKAYREEIVEHRTARLAAEDRVARLHTACTRMDQSNAELRDRLAELEEPEFEGVSWPVDPNAGQVIDPGFLETLRRIDPALADRIENPKPRRRGWRR